MKRGRGVHAEDGNGFALIDEFPDESVCQRTLPGTRRTGDADDVLFGCGGKGAEQFLIASSKDSLLIISIFCAAASISCQFMVDVCG